VLLPGERDRERTAEQEDERLDAALRFGMVDPPVGATSTRYCANVVAPPATGRFRIQVRVFSHSGRTLTTMSRSTPRGMTVYASVTTARSLSRALCGGRAVSGT
jgi:hypothetical protein